MATYKKRGYKPKTKEEKVEIEEQNSTTAEVFSTLDESASKTEEWVSKNQNFILIGIGVIAVAVLGYIGFTQWIQNPKEELAANDLYYPQQYFEQAFQNPGIKDSLLQLSLDGADGKFGLIEIIDEYPGTKAADLARYSAGMAHLELDNYQEAISYLEQYSSSDETFGALAKGGIGDAFAELGQADDALDYYEKAASHSTNDFTTPRFLYKAAVLAIENDKLDRALPYLTRIQEEFPKSDEAANVKALIAFVETKS